MATIKAPNSQYTGISASVPFVNGVGQTDDPRLIAWFESRGYQVEGDAPERESEPKDKPEDKAAPEQEPEPKPKPEDKPKTKTTRK